MTEDNYLCGYILSAEQAAKACGTSTASMKRWLQAGIVKGVKLGKTWATSSSALNAAVIEGRITRGARKVRA